MAVTGASTALRRGKPSSPLKWLLARGFVTGSVLDYGCGHGDDVRALLALGYRAAGYDPAHAPDRGPLEEKYDTVLCTYVLNVVRVDEEDGILSSALSRLAPSGRLLVTVRRDFPAGVTAMAGRGTVQRRVVLPARRLVENSDFVVYIYEGVDACS